MDTMLAIRSYLLIIIPVGVALRVASCLIYMYTSEDGSSAKKKIRNALIFLVLAETIVGLSQLVLSYFPSAIIWPGA